MLSTTDVAVVALLMLAMALFNGNPSLLDALVATLDASACSP